MAKVVSFILREIGDESIIVVRSKDQEVNLDSHAPGVRERLKPLVEKCANLPLDTLRRGPPIRSTSKDDLRRIYYFLVFPSMFFSLHQDYLLVHVVHPIDSTHSKVICEWYFEPETMAKPDSGVMGSK